MSANTLSGLTTNLNQSPYYADYYSTERAKGYVLDLFKPSFAVQARELTNIQAALQQQISWFGGHIFKDGTIVQGGQINLDNTYYYVKLRDYDVLNRSVNPVNFQNMLVQGQTSGLNAIVVATANGTQTSANTKTLFIKYTNSGTSGNTKFFTVGEQLVANNGVTANVITANTAVGTGYNFSIYPGVFYVKGFFVPFSTQSLLLSRYTTTPSYTVGFQVAETIISSAQDSTLLDPAQGAFNFAAPGADRLQLTATLTKFAPGANTGLNYAELFTINNGIVSQNFANTQYAAIEDEMARRMSDQSGDFVVNGMSINLRENLAIANNNGLFTLSQGGNTDILSVGVEPGTAFVKGYETDILVTKYLTTPKGLTYNLANNQIISTAMGDYIIVDELVGAWDLGNGEDIGLYDTANHRISGGKWSTGSQTGTQIGSAKFRAIAWSSGTMGTYQAQYLLYLYDIRMTSAPFSSVRSVYLNSSGSALGADVVLNSGNAVLQETNFNCSVFPLSAQAVRSIRDKNSNIETSYDFLETFTATMVTAGTFSISSTVSTEIFPYSTGLLDNAEARNFIVTVNSAATVSLSGTVTCTTSSNTVTGSGTTFTHLNPGDKINITTVTGGPYIIHSIANDTSLTLLSTPAGNASGQAFVKQYEPGDIIDFTTQGSTGTTRTITVASSTSVNFNVQETISTNVPVTISTFLSNSLAREIKKTLRKNRYVEISCSSAGTTGPFDLGFSDIFQINSIRLSTSAFATVNDGTDVSDSFAFDDGQRDMIYLHGTIKPQGITLTTSDYLLVCLDYFYPDMSQGTGYFSVDSYPIDDVHGYANTIAMSTYQIPFYVSPASGITYDLRNSLDMRPVSIATATDTTSLGSITTNPATTTTLYYTSTGLHLPAPNENITFTYSFYLPRIDIVVMSETGVPRIVQGVPSTTPITPNTPADAMSLATLTIAPYPSLSPFVGAQVGRLGEACTVNIVGYKRYTMKDIGVLNNRITNLEQYAALSQLEQSALNLQITDASGLNRFKNGIFTDSFTSHASGATTNPDYNICMDYTEPCIRPTFETNSINMEYLSGSGISNSNNLITLSYTQLAVAKQPYASDNRNAAGQFYLFKGTLTLTPAVDNWVDTNQNPAIQANDGNQTNWQNLANAWGTQWNDWQTTWTGTTTTPGDVVYLGPQTAWNGASTDQQWVYNTSGQLEGFNPNPWISENFTNTTTVQQRTGTQLVVSTSTQSQDLGNRVIGTSLIPYIRPQIITCSAVGMKASTQLYVFFDGQAMSQYVTQSNSSGSPTKSEGQSLITDSSGNAYFLLRLPSGSPQFTTGNKVVRISDSITNSDSDVTTSAEATFSASGVSEQLQDTILTTTTPNFSTHTVNQTQTLTSTTQNVVVDPLAETFTISLPSTTPGLFLTSIDLYFQSKDPTYGVIIEIRAVDNSGNITSTVLPYSQVVVPSSAINVSQNGTVVTNVKFIDPVYILNNTQYAFAIKPFNNNPNTSVWTAVLGDTDIASGIRITSKPYSGVLFVSSNSTSWSAIQSENIKFTLYCAQFGSSGTVNIVNQKCEVLGIGTPSKPFNIIGEQIRGDDRLTLTGITGGSIANGYFVTGVSSAVTGQIVNINGSVYKVRNVPANKQYTINESLSFKYANGTNVIGLSASVGTQTIPQGTLYNVTSNTLELRDTVNTFAVGELIRGQTSNTTVSVTALENYAYDVIDMVSSTIVPTGAVLTWQANLTSNSYATTSVPIQINNNTLLPIQEVVLGHSNEVTYLSSASSLTAIGSLFTTNAYISPVIDLNKTYSLLIHNLINNTLTGENGASGGSATNKYISQTITLANGQDAEDLNVYLTEYTPASTIIQVYCKILNGQDSDTLATRAWIAMVPVATVNSSQQNLSNYSDIQWNLPTSMMTGPNGVVAYTNSQGVTFNSYKYFALKIVLLASNSAVVPKAQQLRAIALQI